MIYFQDRQQAGNLLAEKLSDHAKDNCVIVSLSEGGLVVGLEIAKKLHCAVYLLVTEDIVLPGEHEPISTMSSAGTYTLNSQLSAGELEALNSDYLTVIEQQKRLAFQKLNRLSDSEAKIPKSLVKNHVVIFVSDGFKNGLSLDVAADFIKPLLTKKLIVATPLASVGAVDKMHLLADQIECLGVPDDYMTTDHYYENNQLPEHEKLVQDMENIILNW